MSHTFYFYDLETSGFDPKKARIMQFAGQRTNERLEPIGEPHNILIKMTQDTLPDPGAILVTGITPQQTVTDGVNEADFLEVFHSEVATPGTIFVGFNTVRFDDEFMRYTNYRNFYDPYEWHWKDDRSRWDLLDLTRMTRALRPDGIQWPVTTDGTPTNKLELLARANNLEHTKAHDALSDVFVSISWAKLIKEKQPKLFEHLLHYRDKKTVAELIETGQPFVYSSGKYSGDYEKTTVACYVSPTKEPGGGVVFDLRYNPADIISLSATELVERWKHYCREYPCPHERAPLKTVKYNRCPAVAPLGVLDEASQRRLKIDMKTIKKHVSVLNKHREALQALIIESLNIMVTQQQQRLMNLESNVDAQLYDSFINGKDKSLLHEVRHHDPADDSYKPDFNDDRLIKLYPLYRARNYPSLLNTEEREAWEVFRKQRLLAGGTSSWAAAYFKQLEAAAGQPRLSKEKRYILEELQLWGESILPME